MDWAIRYRNRGWSVIPARGKAPLVKWETFQSRLPTEQEIKQWWKQWPDANVGVVTGRISNLTVVDHDDLQKVNPYQSEVKAKTGSGGFHHFYQYTPSVQTGTHKTTLGYDYRNDGGFIVLAPSIHPVTKRRYSWLSPWNSALPVFPQKGPVQEPKTIVKRTLSSGWLAEALEGMKIGNIDTTLVRVLGRMRNDNWSPEDAFTCLKPHADRAGATPGHLEDKIKHVWSRYEPRTSENRGLSQFGPVRPLSVCTPESFLEEYQKRLEERKKQTGPEFPTGLSELDRDTGGLRRGNIFLFGARPGTGKTSISLNIAARLLEQGKRVLICTTEMSVEEIYDRFASVLAGFAVGDHSGGSELPLQRIRGFGDRFSVCDEGSPSLDRLKETVKQVKPDVLIFDHLQHVGGAGDSQRENVSKFIKGLHDIAREHNVAVLALSQLRRLFRDMKTNKECRPALSDLKESGTLEEESSVVALLHVLSRDEVSGKAVIIAEIAKNRFGPMNEGIGLEFDLKTCRFKDLEDVG